MSAFWGNNLRITVFGESHGPAIGVTIDGLPSGIELEEDKIARAMARRAPGHSATATQRKEADQVEILSGLYQGKTTGTPLTGIIRNTNCRSQDYGSGKLLRPGHADYTGFVRYQGYNDPAGGGHFSGRLTAPLVFAGAIAESWLAQKGIVVAAHALSIGPLEDAAFDLCHIDAATLNELKKKEFPTLDHQVAAFMQAAILEAKEAQDSIGGVIECAAVGLPAGWGNPIFHGAESVIAQLLFGIPGIKGVEFGTGFGFANLRGSEANDPYHLEQGRIVTSSNHNGGLSGGITNGMPCVLRAAVRPTPSISQPQKTVDLQTMTEEEIVIRGRHDPCIVPRAVPVIEAAVMLAFMDLGLGGVS